jgi:hypothetical protein
MMEQTAERPQIGEVQDSTSSGEHDEGVGWSQIRPGRRHRAHTSSGRIVKEHAWFSPGKPLGNEGKVLAGEGMKRMGDGEEKLPIRVIGCSCQFIQTA